MGALGLLALALAPCPVWAESRDLWLGPDKPLHFAFSAGIAAGGYGLGAVLFDDVSSRLLLGAGLSLAAGAGKELYDATGAGTPSWKDFTWDVLGAATGLLVSWAIDRWLWPHPLQPTRPGEPAALLGFELRPHVRGAVLALPVGRE